MFARRRSTRGEPMRNWRLAALALAGLVALACGRTRPPAAGGGTGGPITVPNQGGTTVTVSLHLCTRCHGERDRTFPIADPLQAAAPPRSVAGKVNGTERGVGAHLSHLVQGNIRRPVPCATCHVIPASGSTHAKQRVSLSGLARSAWPGEPAIDPQYDAATNSCSGVYCHGNFKNGNKSNRPVFDVVDGTFQNCGTCHGIPPTTTAQGGTHPVVSGNVCGGCHTGYSDNSINLDLHVNGQVDVVAGHPPGWFDPATGGLHVTNASGSGANDGGVQNCTVCHGADLSGGSTGIACTSCHRAGGSGVPFSNSIPA